MLRPMTTIAVQDMQRDPLGHLRLVEQGETLLIVRGEQPVAEVKPVAARPRQPRPFGLCEGQLKVPSDLDHPLPDKVVKGFEGE